MSTDNKDAVRVAESVDTPEFRELLYAVRNSSLGFDFNETIAELIAHINNIIAVCIATHDFELDAYELRCQSKDATIKEHAERIVELEAALIYGEEPIRNAALEEAALMCEAQTGLDAAERACMRGAAAAIRALQSQPVQQPGADLQAALDNLAAQFSQPYMEYFGEQIQDAIRALRSQPAQKGPAQ